MRLPVSYLRASHSSNNDSNVRAVDGISMTEENLYPMATFAFNFLLQVRPEAIRRLGFVSRVIPTRTSSRIRQP